MVRNPLDKLLFTLSTIKTKVTSKTLHWGTQRDQTKGRRLCCWGPLLQCLIHTPSWPVHLAALWPYPGCNIDSLPPHSLWTFTWRLQPHTTPLTFPWLPLPGQASGVYYSKEAPITTLHPLILPQWDFPSQAHTQPPPNAGWWWVLINKTYTWELWAGWRSFPTMHDTSHLSLLVMCPRVIKQTWM